MSTTPLNLGFLGDMYLPDSNYCGFVVSCRKDSNDKKALGLDCRFGYGCKDELEALGAKWDGRDSCWYFIFNTPNALKLMVATMQAVMDACLDDPRYTANLGYEPGIYAENIVVPALRKICRLNSEI